MRIAINSHTSGKFERRQLNGRPHIVTSMMAIRGDIAMNRIMYPDKQVDNSFDQLHDLPAPNGHPKINGIHVSAWKPASQNAHNFGGFTFNPKKKGKEVIVDFFLDETVANLSDDGRELIRRIENCEKVGVSTGLNIDTIINQSGTDDFGQAFDRIGEGFHFDHVAILLNEKAAGEHAGTELQLNTDDPNDPIFVVNLAQTNDLSADDIADKLQNMIQSADEDVIRWVHTGLIFPESHIFVWSERQGNSERLFRQSYSVSATDDISIIDIPVEVKLTKEFKPTITNDEDQEMDKTKLVLAIIGLTTNALNGDDEARLLLMSESELIKELAANTKNAVSVEQAREVLTTDGFDFKAFDNFNTNKAEFEAYQTAEKTRLDEMKEAITATNSDWTPELLADKSETELLLINKTVNTSKTAKRVGSGRSPVANSQTADMSDEFVM